MKIDILILEETVKGLNEVIDFFQVRKLFPMLLEHGIHAKIITKIDQIQQDVFYFHFVRGKYDPRLIPFSPRIVVLNMSRGDWVDRIAKFHFAALVWQMYYKHGTPLLYGFKQVGEGLDIGPITQSQAYDAGRGETYYLIGPKDKREGDCIPFVLEYLKVYQKMGLHERTGLVEKR
jgi:hypothetical protein